VIPALSGLAGSGRDRTTSASHGALRAQGLHHRFSRFSGKLGIRSHQATTINGKRIAPKSRQQRITIPLFFGLLKVFLKKRTNLRAIINEQQNALPDYFDLEMSKEEGVE
jgi:hypothetical protein